MEAFCHLTSSKILFGSGRIVIRHMKQEYDVWTFSNAEPQILCSVNLLADWFSFVYGGPSVSADVDIFMSCHTSIGSH